MSEGHVFTAVEASKQVAVRIGEAILAAIESGALPVGARLPGEVELARQFGVSRPSIREALAALQFAGYVESRRGRGTVVVSTDGAGRPSRGPRLDGGEDLIDLLEARLVIEPQVVAIAAERPNRAALDAAAVLLEGMRIAIGDPVFHPTTDLQMHRMLFAACPNRHLAAEADRLLELIAEPALQAARERAWATGELPQLWAEQHVAIFDAIAAERPATAAASAREHLVSVGGNLAAVLEDDAQRRRLRALLAGPLAHPQGAPSP